ncbi:cytochrome P450 [Trametes gibbosa]|nr:cytochrome P450 [Trametes gibbosa]
MQAATAAVFSLFAVLGVAWLRRACGRGNTPPGPKPLPLIGNLFDLTLKRLWLLAASWAEQYGDVVYLHVFGQGILFLNTLDAAVDLLEKKGTIYSDRPHLVMCSELCGCENIVAFAGYGDMFRSHRRLMQSALGAGNIPAYHPLLQVETCAFLGRMMDSPKDYMHHIQRYIGSQTLAIVYGYRVTKEDDPHLKRADQTLDLLSNHIASVGSSLWLVDIFPALKYLPTWFPGASFKRKAAVWKAEIEGGVDAPFQWTKDRLRAGNAPTCYCTMLMTKEADVDEKREIDIKWTAHTMYIASIDTTLTTLSHFVLAMVKHPEVMRKAQAEIDSVTSGERLPNLGDRPALPYVDAVMSESMRWAAPTPLGLPHRLIEDDVYKGNIIPRGTLVFANIWRMTHDPKLFLNPDEFVPERYLEAMDDSAAKRRDPRNMVFGFGRRKCPGVHLAEASLWLAMVSMLATLDFSKAKDGAGNTIEPDPEYNDATFRLPTPFPCVIRPRSERMMHLSRDALSRST